MTPHDPCTPGGMGQGMWGWGAMDHGTWGEEWRQNGKKRQHGVTTAWGDEWHQNGRRRPEALAESDFSRKFWLENHTN
jgi:hypothetical protein